MPNSHHTFKKKRTQGCGKPICAKRKINLSRMIFQSPENEKRIQGECYRPINQNITRFRIFNKETSVTHVPPLPGAIHEKGRPTSLRRVGHCHLTFHAHAQTYTVGHGTACVTSWLQPCAWKPSWPFPPLQMPTSSYGHSNVQSLCPSPPILLPGS